MLKVIYIKIEEADKERLAIEAAKLSLPLTTYCRMVLIKSLSK